jgi:hypothetical protein
VPERAGCPRRKEKDKGEGVTAVFLVTGNCFCIWWRTITLVLAIEKQASAT